MNDWFRVHPSLTNTNKQKVTIMLNITDIQDLIKEKQLNLSDYEDQYELRDALDYNGELHGLIDSAIDIYYYDLRKWAVDNYDEIEEAMEEGLAEGVTDFHKLIQIGQYNYLVKEADYMIGCIFDDSVACSTPYEEISTELETEIVQLVKANHHTEVKLEGAELEAYIAKRFPK
jgi:hypothetical protein